VIKLYGVSSSRALRPLWMLEELGLEYENVPTHFANGDTRTPEFLKLNPNGHIPVLQDGDTVIWESMAINLYLARKYGRGLWPATVAGEGHAFQWSIWAMTELEEPLITALVNRRVLPEAERSEKRAASAAERAAKPLSVLDGALEGRKHLLGDAFSVADLNVASVLVWAKPAGIDLAAWPRLAAWLDGCLSRPALKKSRR
jgi:glutathione S-transferase